MRATTALERLRAPGLRPRLLLTSIGALAVGLGSLLVLGNVLLAWRIDVQDTQLLRERARAEIAALSVSPAGVRVRETPNDAALDQQAWLYVRGREVERPPRATARATQVARALARRPLPAQDSRLDDITLRAERVASSGVGATAVVVVALSSESTERLQEVVLLGSGVLALLVLAGVALVLRRAVDGALRPVAQMTELAEGWGAEDLDRRFALGAPSDELTALAATLDGLLARIAGARRREQRLAAEVAHELRTPLAGIRGRAELALGDPELPPSSRASFEAVVAQAERLSGSIDAILAAARRDLDPASLDLRAVLADLDPELDVEAPEDLPAVDGDAAVVRQALAPLVENARRHATSAVRARLEVGGDEVRVVVCDDGDGLGDGDPERLFEPGVSTSGGAGLGLPLARRLARTHGGDVHAERDAAGGRFVLTLPLAVSRARSRG